MSKEKNIIYRCDICGKGHWDKFYMTRIWMKDFNRILPKRKDICDKCKATIIKESRIKQAEDESAKGDGENA